VFFVSANLLLFPYNSKRQDLYFSCICVFNIVVSLTASLVYASLFLESRDENHNTHIILNGLSLGDPAISIFFVILQACHYFASGLGAFFYISICFIMMYTNTKVLISMRSANMANNVLNKIAIIFLNYKRSYMVFRGEKGKLKLKHTALRGEAVYRHINSLRILMKIANSVLKVLIFPSHCFAIIISVALNTCLINMWHLLSFGWILSVLFLIISVPAAWSLLLLGSSSLGYYCEKLIWELRWKRVWRNNHERKIIQKYAISCRPPYAQMSGFYNLDVKEFLKFLTSVMKYTVKALVIY